MAISDGQMAVLRSFVGGTASDDDLEDRYRRLGSFDAVILETLRSRLAVMVLDEPGVFSVDGLTINQTDNIRSLRAAISEFETSNGSGMDPLTVTTLGGYGRIGIMHRADRIR